MTNLIEMADRLADAMVEEQQRVASCRKDAERVAQTIPENPERGSYYWWAKLCREYTGAHFLDSGCAYGYQYQRGITPEDGPHEFVDFYRGKPQSFSMNLIKFLTTHFDANTEMAEAIEKVLYWYGLWFFPTANWGNVIREMPNVLEALYSCIGKSKNGFVLRQRKRKGYETVEDFISGRYNVLGFHDLRSWQRNLSEDEYVTQALADLPVKEIKLLYEMEVEDASENGRDVYENPGTFYTYGHDNDFNQDWMIDLWLVDNQGDLHAVIRTHNGADARGGYSSPVVATGGDVDYLFDWQMSGYCFSCHEQYDNIYRYDKELEKLPGVDLPLLKEKIRLYKEHEAGQLEIEGLEFKYNENFSIQAAEAVVKYLEEYFEYWDEEAEIPVALAEKDGELEAIEDGDNSVYSIYELRFLCPECGAYTVGWHSSVEGY